jgi:hypothetical protein
MRTTLVSHGAVGLNDSLYSIPLNFLQSFPAKRGLIEMKHLEIRWNPEFQEWLCVRCGRTSDHVVYEDAQAELALFECELPAASDA